VEREVVANAATNRHDFLVALENAEKRQDDGTAQGKVAATRPGAPLLRVADAGRL